MEEPSLIWSVGKLEGEAFRIQRQLDRGPQKANIYFRTGVSKKGRVR